MDSNYHCAACSSEGLSWKETSVQQTDAAGVANAKARTLQRSRELRDQLRAHFAKSDAAVWVAVQNRGENDTDQYWIGRATGIAKIHSTAGHVAGNARARYGKGDMEIAVEWFQRDISGGDERRIFTAWKRVVDADGKVVDEGPVKGKVYTFNSTELRMIHVEMQLVPPVGGVPLNEVRRTSSRTAKPTDRAHQNLAGVTKKVQTQRADPPNLLWEIPAGNERLVLGLCC